MITFEGIVVAVVILGLALIISEYIKRRGK